MHRFVIVVASVTGAVGMTGFLRGWDKANPALLQTSGPLVVAALALMGVAIGVSTWRDERHKAREAQQRESYARLVEHTFGRFAGQEFDSTGEAKLRSEVVTWGDPGVVKALGGWNQAFDAAVGTTESGAVALSTDQQQAMRKAMAAVVFAVRHELQVEPGATAHDIERALFNE